MWKLSIKGSRIPWTCVDRRLGSFGNVHGLTRAWLPDLDEFLCASVSLKHCTDLGRGG